MAAVAALGLAVAVGAPRARGGPLDPGAFTPLGALNITSGSYTFNTTTDQLLDSSNHVLFTGVTFNGIAVFDFSGITISGGNLSATGTNPLALMSQGDIRFTGGSINLDGGPGGAGGLGGLGGLGGGGPAGTALWNSGTYGHPGASLVLDDGGTLAILDQGTVIWSV
jgi:hypothetical protein